MMVSGGCQRLSKNLKNMIKRPDTENYSMFQGLFKSFSVRFIKKSILKGFMKIHKNPAPVLRPTPDSFLF